MTKLYLRNKLSTERVPSAGKKSTVLGNITTNNTFLDEMQLSTVKGAASAGRAIAYVASGVDGNAAEDYLGRYCSDPLAVQTFGSGTWTYGFAANEGNAGHDAFAVCSLYIWRPTTQAVVGYIYDSATLLGTEWTISSGLATAGRVVTFTGANVTVQAGDILVFEAWARHPAGFSPEGDHVFMFGGSTEPTASSSAVATTDVASYINTATTITFGTPISTLPCWGPRVL